MNASSLRTAALLAVAVLISLMHPGFPASARTGNVFEIRNPANFRCLGYSTSGLLQVAPCFPVGAAGFRWQWQIHQGRQYLVNMENTHCVKLAPDGTYYLALLPCDYRPDAPGLDDQWVQVGKRIMFRGSAGPDGICLTRQANHGVNTDVVTDGCRDELTREQEWDFVAR
ncbi:hypothetical protein [Nocardia sp. NPDC051832]|uniref:hypothetical protein n=1 Tax=Nocardia sp. NPDC051832 TaxID=3155673 RepID=UPI003416B287